MRQSIFLVTLSAILLLSTTAQAERHKVRKPVAVKGKIVSLNRQLATKKTSRKPRYNPSLNGLGVVAPNSVNPPDGSILPLVAGGAIWVRGDNGAGWVGKTVSVGAEGTQVFSDIEFGLDHAELISGFSPNPAMPVWQNYTPTEGTNTYVDSAETNDVHVSITQRVQAGNQSIRIPVLTVYDSDSSNPRWTYSFPATSGQSRVEISDDGRTIVAASLQVSTARLTIAIFGPNSPVPLWIGDMPFGTTLRGFELSADGSTLYASSLSTAYIWDTITHSLRTAVLLPGSFDAHAISGNGSVFAFGGFNSMDIYERQPGGGYLKTYTYNILGNWVFSRIAISGASNTVAFCASGYASTINRVKMGALDVATKAQVMSNEVAGVGSLQNVCSDVDISDDGIRMAFGLWGDEGGAVAELNVFDLSHSASAPIFTSNTPGSLMDLDISANGRRVAAAFKATHANILSGGGSLELYAPSAEDIRVTGVPLPGANVTVTISGDPHKPARLLVNTLPGNENVPAGLLCVARENVLIIPMPNTDSNGNSSISLRMPNGSGSIGQKYYIQGFLQDPRHLTGCAMAQVLGQ